MKDVIGGGPSPIGGGGEQTEPADTRPPAPAETQRLQALLDDAESEIADLEARVAELESELEAARQEARLEALERTLADAGVIDRETASMLLSAALAENPDANPNDAVRDLRARKPFLFADASKRPNAAMAPGLPPDELGDLAGKARTSGDRAALLRYLRRRRAT